MLVFIISAWLLNKGVNLTWRYLFFGLFPLDLVFINAKGLVLRPSIFSALCDNQQGRATGLV